MNNNNMKISNHITRTFEEKYFGSSTRFMVFVEQNFIDNEFYKGDYINNNIESYYGDYLKYCDNLTKKQKYNLLVQYRSKKI